jgi:hypothetical protein
MSKQVKTRRRWLTITLLIIAGGMGCSPLQLPFYIFGPSVDSEKTPATGYNFYTKAREDKHKKEIKVVVLPYHSRSVALDYAGADIKLANAYVKKLTEKFVDNKERVKIVPIHDVEKFKQEHPEWKTMGAKAIGDHFKADYIFDMELSGLGLYDRKSRQPFLLGNIRVSFMILDVEKEGEDPVYNTEFVRQFPKLGARPVDLDNSSSEKFQQEFFQHVAMEMTWLVTAHTAEDEKSLEE